MCLDHCDVGFYVSDEEILDVFSESVENSTVLRQDVIFARFSFSLCNGMLSLLHSSQALPVPLENGICCLKTSVGYCDYVCHDTELLLWCMLFQQTCFAQK